MNALEQEIMQEVSQLEAELQKQVLAYIHGLKRPYTARELMTLPAAERERYIAVAFALAADENFEIFEANSEESSGVN